MHPRQKQLACAKARRKMKVSGNVEYFLFIEHSLGSKRVRKYQTYEHGRGSVFAGTHLLSSGS